MSVNTLPLTDHEVKQWFDAPDPRPADTFEIALVLGGTVSAGAYTAGVLDFLFEALDNWTALRDANAPNVPTHKVVIKFITGTSGGGVNAAIAARALNYEFPHIRATTPVPSVPPHNPFYHLWVNITALSGFLGTSDLEGENKKLVSILNGEIIDQCAAFIEVFATAKLRTRSYLGYPDKPLRLILTLTNLRGVPYRTNFGDPKTVGPQLAESYVDHADYARFAILYPNASATTVLRPDEFTVGFPGSPIKPNLRWEDFGQFACATCAFPLGFPARRLSRPTEHYRYRVVVVPGDDENAPSKPVALVPDWDKLRPDGGGSLPDIYDFFNVDGGATDNEPIELARSALAGITGRNPRDERLANRAVILVDPFAGETDPGKQPSSNFYGMVDGIGGLVGAMIQQTRYDSQDIYLATHDDVYSRFMIAATRRVKNGIAVKTGDEALASAGLAAFIGFAHEKFMRHDYFLGRANCQEFLKTQFVLPAYDAADPNNKGNEIFKGSWDLVPDRSRFEVRYPGDPKTYLPIIPLYGSVAESEQTEDWPAGVLDPEKTYRDAIKARVEAVISAANPGGALGVLIGLASKFGGASSIADFAVGKMKDALPKNEK